MALKLVLCYISIRIIIPLLLLFAVVIRQNFFSALYLLFLLSAPFLSFNSFKNITKAAVGIHLKLLITVSCLICATQVTFQIYFLTWSSSQKNFDYCSTQGQIYRAIGFNQLKKENILSIFCFFIIDFVVLFVSAFVYLFTLHVKQKCLQRKKKKHEQQSQQKSKLSKSEISDEKKNVSLEKNQESTIERACSSLFQTTLEESSNLKRDQRKLQIKKSLYFINYAYKMLFNALLCGSGILNPSLISLFYFISFLFIATFIACNFKSNSIYRIFPFFTCFLIFFQIVSLFLYQVEFFRNFIPSNSLEARLLGLQEYFELNCTTLKNVKFKVLNWNIFAHPLFLILLYYLSGFFIHQKVFIKNKKSTKKLVTGFILPKHDISAQKAECFPLLTGRQAKTYQTLDEKILEQKDNEISPTDKVVRNKNVSTLQTSVSYSMELEETEKEQRFGRVFYFINIIKRSSYAATLIVMMTWSITYHSWCGFIFLLWSCIIWMMPNSRQACLKSSFALVFYALMLLLVQYVFSLNLTDQELPQTFGSISLKEFGFQKYYELSYKPLALKVIFTLMFWVTFRQYREEKAFKKCDQINVTLNISSPQSYLRHFSVSNVDSLNISSSLLSLSNSIHSILVKYWIWVVTIMLMVMSFDSKNVVIYRVFYMLLFLSFIFILQISFKLWRRLMYPFWSIVIIYSMTILIAIYTYQFANFENYWRQYLHIGIEMQADLGLKKYDADPWILFKELFTPTFFLIITIIQLRFLHKDFLELTKLEDFETRPCSTSSTSQNQAVNDSNSCSQENEMKIDIDPNLSNSKQTVSQIELFEANESIKNKTYQEINFNQLENKSKATNSRNKNGNINDGDTNEDEKIEFKSTEISFKKNCKQIYDKAGVIYNYLNELLWRFLEIHISKFILFYAIHTSLNEVTVINVNLVFLVIIAIAWPKFEKFVSYILGFWTSLIILTKMIYQLNIVWNSTSWIVNCTKVNLNGSISEVSSDNRLFLGFRKDEDIVNYIIQDLLITLLLTLRVVIIIRQRFYRHYLEIPASNSSTIFSEISRKDAECGAINLLKYLVNYGFYKFGLEITFIVMIIAIVNRNDVIAALFSIALLFLIFPKRQTVQKIWPYFLALLCVIFPIEYLACLGLPPGLCLNYPWDSLSFELLDWFFLPVYDVNQEKQRGMTAKLYYDFFVMVLVSRQWIVFKIEKHDVNSRYPGGSNADICFESNFQNDIEIKDFFTHKPTLLDYIKSIFFSCSFWVALAVIFLTAMSPDNIFGVGYIIGCFILLWNGNDFYLKPLNTIFIWWKLLIAYNVAVIFSKNIFGILGCLYSSYLTHDFCWTIQMLGIICNRGTQPTENQFCQTSLYSISMTWDTICFAFLIIQKRIFGSYYFSYLVKEIKAQHILASRGVELINEIQMKEVRDQENAEKEVMEKIKAKMDRIRANQQLVSIKTAEKNKYHHQAYDYQFDESEYHSLEPTISHTLPTVYSTTPSLTTNLSPSSAASCAEGKGYLEVIKIPYLPAKYIDSFSSSQSIPAPFSHTSSPFEENSYFQYSFVNTPPYNGFSMPKSEEFNKEAIITNRTSFRFHQKSSQPISRLASLRQKFANISSLEASHGSSIKSGDYFMFDDLESESVNLIEKSHESQVPDPVGEELDKLANIRGLTAFCSQLMKSLSTQQEILDRQKIEENTDIGESSKDSAIVSVDRTKNEVDFSLSTQDSPLKSDSLQKDQLQEHQDCSRSNLKKQSLKKYKKLNVETDETFNTENDSKRLSIWKKLDWWLKVTAEFCTSCTISATAKLNVVSRDYRYVSRRLSVEKKVLKKLFEEKNAKVISSNWKKESHQILTQMFSSNEFLEQTPFKEKIIKKIIKEGVEKSQKFDDLEFKIPDPYLDSNVFARFTLALFYAIISHSEFLCYFLVILNQINNASILSLPLPLIVFLWGCLSVPRPTKTFWISVITYTEVIIVIKYIFSFRVWPWTNRFDQSPFWLPRILGIYKKDYSENLDLFLLLALFFHRFMLKSLGLWDLNLNSSSEKNLNNQNFENTKEKAKFIKSNQSSIQAENSNSILRKRKNVADKLESSSESEENELEEEEFETELQVVSKLFETSGSLKKSFSNIIVKFRDFFHRLLSPSCSITRDCYALMFFCDFINFFTVWFGYSAFGSNLYASDITTYLQENRVPMPFLIMLLLQFALIVIDRALYLRKNKKGRLLFHVFIVIFIHGWLFFGLPALTQRQFTTPSNLAPKFWYIIKSMYLLLSASQIKSGYPTRILGNCFTKKYGLINSTLFTLYMMVPFLYDMRLIMDWIWTDTSLQLTEWAIMEDINKQLFERKCALTFEENFPEPKGQERRRFAKYIRGGLYLLAIMFAIWFPLVLFALGGTVGQSLKPADFSVELEFSGYQPIFKMSATSDNLKTFTDDQWKSLEDKIIQNPFAQNFLSSYALSDATIAQINGNSTATWSISPPSQLSLINELEKNSTIVVKITWLVTRKQSKNQNLDASISQSNFVKITPENETLRYNLTQMLKNASPKNSSRKSQYAILQAVFPNYIKVPESGYPTQVDAFGSSFRDIKIVLQKGSYENKSSQWWEVFDDCGPDYPFHYLKDEDTECMYLVSVLFNDKIFPGAFLQLISGYGIFGLYTTFVFVASRIIHGYFADICYKVIYTEMPCVDRVLQLCLDIYLVRESREFSLEEDLYAKLIFLYRSPETLIKWTRPLKPIESKNEELKEE